MKSFKFIEIAKPGALVILIVSLTAQLVLGQVAGSVDLSDLVVTQMVGDNDGYGYGLLDGSSLPATEHADGNWYFDNRTEQELDDPFARFTDHELPDHPNAVLVHNIDISLFTQVDSLIYTVDISGLHSNRKCRMFVDDNEQFDFAELPSQSARGSGVFSFRLDPATISDGELRVEFKRLANVNGPKWGDDWALDYCVLTVYGQGSTVLCPILSVEPDVLDFGQSLTSQEITITNNGYGSLDYSINTDQPWIIIDMFGGSLDRQASDSVLVRVDRFGLPPGEYSGHINVISNGGTATVDITMSVSAEPVLHVTPRQLDYGAELYELTITIDNIGSGTLEWSLSTDQEWLGLDALMGSTGDELDVITVTINRAGLTPSEYSDSIAVTSNAGEATVEVSMTVSDPGEIPELLVDPIALEFSTNIAQQSLTIRNIGAGTLFWSVSSEQNWIEVGTVQGNTTTETDLVSIAVNRDGLEPGVYAGIIAVASNGGSATVSVSMEVQTSPVLQLSPLSLDFGSDEVEQALTIENLGELPLQWNVTDDQEWISLSPGSGITASEPDQVLVTVNRAGLAPGEYSGLVTVISNGGNDSAEVLIVVSEVPLLAVSSDSLDFGLDLTTQTFSLSNTGYGTLDWSLVTDRPWIIIDPLEGSITTGSQQVTVIVNRENFAPGTHRGGITVSSNGGSGYIAVTMEIEAAPVLSVTPLDLDFDRTQTELSFGISNHGGGELNWTVVANQTWIDLNPVTGTTTWATDMVTVIVDRSGLNPGHYSGVITVTSDYGSVDVSVDMVLNSPPEFAGGTQDGAAVEWATFQRIVTVTDSDGDDLQIACTEKPTDAAFIDNGDGTGLFTFTPDYQFVNQHLVIGFEASDGLSITPADFQLMVENFQLQVGQTSDDFDVMVHSQIEIPFNEPIMESSLSTNLMLTSAYGAPLEYEYFGLGSTTPLLVIHPPAGVLFTDLDTIQVRLVGGPGGVLDLAGLPMESDYSEFFLTGASVYPGDTDDNGVVDERDILPIGMFYNQPGPVREQTGTLWQVYMAHALTPAAVWSPPRSVYADADGNGIVNGDDICAVTDNWQNRVPLTSTLMSQSTFNELLALKPLETSKLIEINQALAECPQSTGREIVSDLLDNALGNTDPTLPTSFNLYQNYPNPFNPETSIQFDLPEASHALLTVYNVAGQRVAVLLDGPAEAGVHIVTWDGRNAEGRRAASGIYLYRLVTDTQSITRRMLLLK
ncbi:MAG: hypothetical protein DRP45_02290 [Candidatus Zixiibacteriota bacterium]|nr:MAG: hypothetical protein DRP45_02290 [candidate division Zixibacteria bacterium]